MCLGRWRGAGRWEVWDAKNMAESIKKREQWAWRWLVHAAKRPKEV